MNKIIDGKALAEKIKDEVVGEIIKLNGDRPNLAIVLVGKRQDSELYVKLKEREAKRVGIDTHLYKCDEDISERELLEVIDCLNNDQTIDAILVQLPLPENFDTDTIIMAINPGKDVDGFHPENLQKLFVSCNHAGVIPPVIRVVLDMLEEIKCEIKDKKICLVVNSEIFGKSLVKVLECREGEVEITNSKDINFQAKTRAADILITAVGVPCLITKEMVKPGAVVIDIGITKQKNKVVGDVDFDQVKEVAEFITPVPGGVGPMTIAEAFKNILKIYKKIRSNRQETASVAKN